MYFSDRKNDLLLHGAKIVNEYDTNHFVESAKVLEGVDDIVKSFNYTMVAFYRSFLEQSILQLKNAQFNKKSLDVFEKSYTKIKFIGSGKDISEMGILANKYSFLLRKNIPATLFEFKPKYLHQYASSISDTITAVVRSNKVPTKLNSDSPSVVSDSLSKTIEKQVVRNAKDYGFNNSTSGTLQKADNNGESRDVITNKYIENDLLPILKRFVANKTTITAEADSVLGQIIEVEKNLDVYESTLLKVINDDSYQLTDEVKVFLRKYMYISTKALLLATTYIIYCMTQKIEAYVAATRTADMIIASSHDFLENTQRTESVKLESIKDDGSFDERDIIVSTEAHSVTDDFLAGSAKAFDVIAQEIYDFHTSPSMYNYYTKLTQSDSKEKDQQDYDSNVYDVITKMYLEISAGLDILSTEGGDYLMIFDDALKASGFQVGLESRFQNEIRTITDVSQYKSSVDLSISNHDVNIIVYLRMINEIKMFGDNMDKLSQVAHEVYNKLHYLQKRYDDDVNGEYKNLESITELKAFLSQLDSQYVDLANDVCKGFFARLSALGQMVTSLEDVAPGKNTSVDQMALYDKNVSEAYKDYVIDYNFDVFKDALVALQVEQVNRIKEVQEALYKENYRKKYGYNVVFEKKVSLDTIGKSAADTSKNTTNNNTSNGNDNNKTNNKNQNAGADNQDTQNSNQDTNSNNTDNTNKGNTNVTVTDNSGQGSGGQGSNVGDRVAQFIQQVVDKFMGFIKSEQSKQRLNVINTNKDAVLQRDDSKITAQILPYDKFPVDQMISALNSYKSTIDSLAGDGMKGLNSPQDVAKKLLSPFNFDNVNNDTDFNVLFTDFFKIGKHTGNPQVQTYTGDQLKSMVNDSVTFLTQYYQQSGGIADKIQASLNNITASIKKSCPPSSDAETNSKNKVVADVTNALVGSVFNAITDRSNDMFKLFNGLIPSGNATNNNNNQDNNGKNNNQNNNGENNNK